MRFFEIHNAGYIHSLKCDFLEMDEGILFAYLDRERIAAFSDWTHWRQINESDFIENKTLADSTKT